jgi:hypothetical protein
MIRGHGEGRAKICSPRTAPPVGGIRERHFGSVNFAGNYQATDRRNAQRLTGETR